MHAKQFLGRLLCIAFAALINLCPAHAQSAIDEVHIEPRVQAAQPDSPNSTAKNTLATIRKNVELVLVPVTVTDAYNRFVTGLEPGNFQLFQDKHPQPIKYFWKDDTPVSVGIVFDVSGSMITKIERARDAVVALLQASNPQDEFFLMTFADQPTLVQDFTSNADDIQGRLPFTKPNGNTSLIDAVFMAMSHMRSARYSRRALVIISDGGDNRSRYTENELKSVIKEGDVLVYSIGVFDTVFRTQEERLGPDLLATISGLTGASSYILQNPNHLPVVAEHIGYELRNQYILGYRPDNSAGDGKWRKIKVKLELPRGFPTLQVQARPGYYSALSNKRTDESQPQPAEVSPAKCPSGSDGSCIKSSGEVTVLGLHDSIANVP